jgi:hypothetical protein
MTGIYLNISIKTFVLEFSSSLISDVITDVSSKSFCSNLSLYVFKLPNVSAYLYR